MSMTITDIIWDPLIRSETSIPSFTLRPSMTVRSLPVWIQQLICCAVPGQAVSVMVRWYGPGYPQRLEDLERTALCRSEYGIAGIPWWTTDIGGFMGGDPTDPSFRQLFVRWFQWGTFCPVMRLHGDRNPSKPFNHADGSPSMPTGADNEIWSYGEENTPILEKYIQFREAMRPYLRKLMNEVHEFGKPVMRTMFYEFPQDEIAGI